MSKAHEASQLQGGDLPGVGRVDVVDLPYPERGDDEAMRS